MNSYNKPMREGYLFKDRNQKELDIIANEILDISLWFRRNLEIEIYVTAGVLLGSVRNEDFISWDDDVDLAYVSKYSRPSDIVDEFNIIISKLIDNNMYIGTSCKVGNIHFWSPSNKYNIAIWTSWIGDDKNYYCVPNFHKGELDEKDIVPLSISSLRGVGIPVPANPHKWLKCLYGDGYNTPTDYVSIYGKGYVDNRIKDGGLGQYGKWFAEELLDEK